MMADADNEVWIRQGGRRPTFGPPPPQVYDVVNRVGRLVKRVEIPLGIDRRRLWARNGLHGETSREGNGTVLAKYRIP